MKIAILVEGATEVAFKEKLCEFLQTRLGKQMPRLKFIPQNGRIPKEEKLRRVVENLLSGNSAHDAVIALTDIYTGTKDFRLSRLCADKTTLYQTITGFQPSIGRHFVAFYTISTTDPEEPDFQDATDAKEKMMEWVGNNPKFYPHTALHDFEAWLLPYWETIRSLAKHNRSAPSGSPETVNHQKPPSYWIKEIFESGRQSSYDKPIHGAKILKKNELMIAIQACPELKAFVNQIISLCDGSQIIA